jgi:hypothetical protein
LPINNCNNIAIAYDDITWANIPMGETGPVLARMALRDGFTIHLCTILQWDMSAEKRMKFFIAEKVAESIVPDTVVKALS